MSLAASSCRLLLLSFLTIVEPAAAQQNPSGVASSTLRSEVKLVLLPVTVTDRKGAAIESLKSDDFVVMDGKVPQPIVSFHAQDSPCSVGIVLDISGSMRKLLPAAKAVVKAFLDASNPEDDFFLLTVSSRPEVRSVATADVEKLEGALQAAAAGGSTALVDTVYAALEHIRPSRNAQRALLVISDGMDNHSRHSKAELLRMATETDAQIYTIAVDEPAPTLKPVQTVEKHNGLLLMGDLAEKTGGLGFVIRNAGEAPGAAAKAGFAIRNQYVIGFRPQSADDTGKWHRIQVQVNVRNANVYTRKGYYAP